MNLEDLASKSMSRIDLANFISKLVDSLEEDLEIWENKTLKDFLEALSAWTMDMDGYFMGIDQEVPDSPTWELFAGMLLGARVYE